MSGSPSVLVLGRIKAHSKKNGRSRPKALGERLWDWDCGDIPSVRTQRLPGGGRLQALGGQKINSLVLRPRGVLTSKGAHDTGTGKALRPKEEGEIRLYVTWNRASAFLVLVSSLGSMGVLKGSNCMIHMRSFVRVGHIVSAH